MTKRFLFALSALSLFVAACVPQAADVTTPESTQPNQGTVESGTTTPPSGPREVTRVNCSSAPDEVEIVCEAYDLIKKHYVDPVPDQTLASAAIEGLETLDGASSNEPLVCVLIGSAFTTSCDVAAREAENSAEAAEAIVEGFAAFGLDANSTYFDPQELELLAEEQQGEIQGIGALVSPEDQTIEGDNKQCSVLSETCKVTIVSTISGAPAEAAGLMKDDEIVGVDGESVLGWSVDQLTAAVRGPAGTDVTITIDRGGERFDVTITRAAVEIPIIESDIFDNTGYIHLQLFTSNAGERFQLTVASQLSQGIERLVIDLRNNPGGLLDAAIEVASVFLTDGDVVITQGPGETLNYPVVSGARIVPENMPVIFVVNKGSASASEVVSGVLQETGRVTVVGENTFGKNTVQRRFGLSNGGALKLTIARWLTPGGLDFGGVGITPDIEMVFENDLTAEDLVAAVLAS